MALDLSYNPASLTEHASFEEANPWISAVNSLNAIRNAQLTNQNLATTNQYQPGLLQNQTLQGQLANQKSQAEQPYWAQQAAADVAQKNATAGYENSEAGINNIKINNPLLLTTGDIGQAQAAIQILKSQGKDDAAAQVQKQLNEKIKATQVLNQYRATEAQTAQQRADTARANAQSKALGLPGVQTVVNTIPSAFTGFTNYAKGLFNSGNPASSPTETATTGGIPTANSATVPSIPNPNQPASTNAAVTNPDTVPIDPDKLSDTDFSVRQANIQASLKKQYGSKYLNRLNSGIALERLIQDPTIQHGFDLMNKYKGRLGGGWIKEGLGFALNDPDYLAMKAARDQFQSMIVGGLSALEGYPSTDKAANQAKAFYQNAQKSFNQSPEQARAYINSGKDFIHAETNSLLAATPYKVKDFIRTTNSNLHDDDAVTLIDSNGGKHIVLRKNIAEAVKRAKQHKLTLTEAK